MLYLTLAQLLTIHARIMAQSGGASGVRDLGALESSVAQPRMTFQQQALYVSLADKAAALAHSIIQNHPFVDGNKRTGHAAMEVFLILNGFEIRASIDEQEEIILAVASGNVSRSNLAEWLNGVLHQKK